MTRYKVNPACAFLLRAFAPGCPTLLKCWSHKVVRIAGERCERVAISYALPDDDARRWAAERVDSAGSLHQVTIGRRSIRAASAQVAGDLLAVDVLLAPASPLKSKGSPE